MDDWLGRAAVKLRLDALDQGHARWAERRKSARGFPRGPYVCSADSSSRRGTWKTTSLEAGELAFFGRSA